jgi:hypothetical protein
MRTTNLDTPHIEQPLAGLERQLIAAYLADAGFEYYALLARHDEEARRLLARAGLYASERLSQIEARAHYVHDLHGE